MMTPMAKVMRSTATPSSHHWLGRLLQFPRAIWSFLRTWSGDDAYERYVTEHRYHGHALLSRREFYRNYLNHRGGGSRCC
jgi:uncharacterized short protein YbdD (DUF466 family)